jgi:peptidoglycan/xylan/chitin deacetylase (PgdA/CDA1 family)
MKGLRWARAESPLRARTVVWISVSAALIASVAGWGYRIPAATAVTPAIVTIGFDDGTVDQFTQAFPILAAHDMHATFFVNTAPIIAGDASRMSWSDLHALFDAGNEITGHTLDHVNIQPLAPADAEAEVCADRNNLLGQGFAPESFAYPFGSFDATSEAVVHYCGYNSGRGVSGISKSGPYGETIPPLDAYATRTPPNPKKATKLATLELYVTNAENDTTQSSDWVQFVFHKVCDKSTGGHCGPYSISPAKFSALLDFLQAEVAAGRVVVETTAQVIGGPLNPACDPVTGNGCQSPAP